MLCHLLHLCFGFQPPHSAMTFVRWKLVVVVILWRSTRNNRLHGCYLVHMYLINLQEGTTDTGPLPTRKQRHLSFHGLLESRLLLGVDVLMRGFDGVAVTHSCSTLVTSNSCLLLT
jgi:hypothetical protein